MAIEKDLRIRLGVPPGQPLTPAQNQALQTLYRRGAAALARSAGKKLAAAAVRSLGAEIVGSAEELAVAIGDALLAILTGF